jgi:pSer/pThr/pTyr-binding forkhead associated (FHA) protein
MPAQLVSLRDGPNIQLDKPILLLGRHPECDIQIDSRKISRRHCCIALVNDYLVVRDLGSTNGVRINGIRVIEGQLAAGDELTIGSHSYRVTWESEEEPPRRTAPAKPRGRTLSDDQDLESCDEPVPLPEPGKPSRNHPPRSLPGPRAPLAGDPAKILPDQIDLLPSDPYPGVSSSPSHH